MVSGLSDLIRFNALKHHYGYFRARMERWEKMPWDRVAPEIHELGSNQFDVYTGTLSTDQIISQAAEQMCRNDIVSVETLERWLGKLGYRTITLSDESKWVIRRGEDPVRYIHLHPARRQKLAVRIKASHLKTAIALQTEAKTPEQGEIEQTTQLINRARTAKLGLSPVRSASESRRILETWKFIQLKSSP